MPIMQTDIDYFIQFGFETRCSDALDEEFLNITLYCQVHQNDATRRKETFQFPVSIRRMAWTRHVARIREKRNAYKNLVGKPNGTRPLGKTKHR
jgi:hypothetical protein